MSNVKGRGVRVEIAASYGASKAITAISKAATAVATCAAHGYTNNTVGYLVNVSGMVELEGQAVRLKNVTTDTFELQGINSTNFSDFNSGTFVPVSTWETMAESTSYAIGGGAGDKLNASRLIDTRAVEEQGNPPAATASLSILSQETPSAAMQVVISATQTGAAPVVRVTFNSGTGALRLWRGEPSLPGEDVQQGQLGTGSMDFAVKGQVLQLAA